MIEPTVWYIKDAEYTTKIKMFLEKNINGIYLLNTTNPEKFDFLEKYVYEIALFHFKRLNIQYCNKTHYIEFFIKCSSNSGFIKRANNKSIMSCLTYLNDCESPIMITNTNNENYKYKIFQDDRNIILSIPQSCKHISFDFLKGDELLHLFYKKNEVTTVPYILCINLYDIMPKIGFYNNINNTLINEIQKIEDITIEKSVVDKLSLNYNERETHEFYEELLYSNNITDENYIRLLEPIKNKDVLHPFSFSSKDPAKQVVMNDKSDTDCAFSMRNDVKDMFISLKPYDNKLLGNAVNDIGNDIDTIMDPSNNILFNRFVQRFKYNKIYTPDICNWIISETENHASSNKGWTTSRHERYPTTDIPVGDIKSILQFVLTSFYGTILPKIEKSYCLDDTIMIDINDLFIVKYHEKAQNNLELHKDGSLLSFNILLSDTKEFDGGGTYFEDGITEFLEQGDLLVHCGKTNHSGLSITRGRRYVLVAFLNIIKKDFSDINKE